MKRNTIACSSTPLRAGAAAAACLVLLGGSAMAQEKFPSRPVEIIIPAPPGGGTDVLTRVLAEIAEPALGQKIVIINRAGGAGVPGFVSVMNAKPDGYTLGSFSFGQLAIQPHTMAAVPYKPADFAPIGLYSAGPAVFCVRPAFPAANGKEFIEMLKANPGKYTYGTSGLGGTIHIAAERIFRKLGVSPRPIPFSGGGETLKNFLGGHIDIYGGTVTPVLPHVQSGAARCPLFGSASGNPLLPQATNLTQLGIPEAETLVWRGLFGPKAMSADRVAFLDKVFSTAARSDKYKGLLAKSGEEALALGSAEAKKLVDKDYADIGEIVRNLGLAKK